MRVICCICLLFLSLTKSFNHCTRPRTFAVIRYSSIIHSKQTSSTRLFQTTQNNDRNPSLNRICNNAFASITMTILISMQSLPGLLIENVNAATSIESMEDQIIKLFKTNTPSVVYINTYLQRLDAFSMNIMEVSTTSFSNLY